VSLCRCPCNCWLLLYAWLQKVCCEFHQCSGNAAVLLSPFGDNRCSCLTPSMAQVTPSLHSGAALMLLHPAVLMLLLLLSHHLNRSSTSASERVTPYLLP
jgi:hypothetical protein